MFDFFRRHTRLLQFLLVLLVFPAFVFFGIQGYTKDAGADAATVATVGGQRITQADWDVAQREQLDRARAQMPSLEASFFQTPEMRRLSLEALIRDRVLLQAADKLHLATTDDRLDRLFKADPQFAFLRNPDGSLNRDEVNRLGLSSEGFADRLRQDISRRQVLSGVGDSAMAPQSAASAALDAFFQQREVQIERISAKDFLAQSQPSDADIEAFYKAPANAGMFMAPEEATVEYVVLDPDTLKAGVTVSDADLKSYYDQNAARFMQKDERRASHILVAADKDAPKAEREKAKAKADGLLAELKKDPSRFAELATKNSDDPGSAAKGGDLDWFGRGQMVPPFEAAAFGLKPGETSGVVETDYGYHVIKLTESRGGDRKPFEAVRGELEAEVRNQLAQKRYNDAAVEFGDTVYEQSDSLKPVADKYKLAVQRADHVLRSPAPGASGVAANPRFLEALFAAETLRDKRNTKAVDIGKSQLASGRIVEYRPATQRPIAEVKEQIRAQLAAQKAADASSKRGAERLAAAKAAPATAFPGETVTVSRAQARDLPRSLLDAVLRAPQASLPTVVGVPLGTEGYAIARVVKVAGRDPVVGDAQRSRSQYAQAWAAAESDAAYTAWRTRLETRVTENAKLDRAPATEPR